LRETNVGHNTTQGKRGESYGTTQIGEREDEEEIREARKSSPPHAQFPCPGGEPCSVKETLTDRSSERRAFLPKRKRGKGETPTVSWVTAEEQKKKKNVIKKRGARFCYGGAHLEGEARAMRKAKEKKRGKRGCTRT